MTKPVAIYYNMLQYQPESLAMLSEHFDVITLQSPKDDDAATLSRANVLFAPLGYQVDKQKIDSCPSLRVVASNTTGHPHIDVDYCKELGIGVACLKFAPAFLQSITPTAELAFGQIIALTRNVIKAHESCMAGDWNRRPFGASGMLSRKRLGVVGLGRLGSLVARYGDAFGMEVGWFDPYVQSFAYRRYASLHDLARNCDILSLHVPHEKTTENMVDQSVFDAMPRGSYFVNTARGELVDWAALLVALKSGHLAGAALDVFEGEFVPGFADTFRNHPLLDYARSNGNVLLTPHIGGSTIDAWRETEMKTIEMSLDILKSSE